MKIAAFLLCYNELSMLPHTLNYYSKFCNEITIFDNYSTDGSIEFIKNNFPEISIVRFDSYGELREDIQRDIRNNCWKESNADYVIVCDMDEFLFSNDMNSKFEFMKKNYIALPVVTGYNMISEIFPDNYNIPITEQVNWGFRDKLFDKNIIFSPVLIQEINFAPGSHTCEPIFKVHKHKDFLVEFKLLHYKYLSKEYLYKKHNQFCYRMSDINLQHRWGNEYLKKEKHIDEIYNKAENFLYNITG